MNIVLVVDDSLIARKIISTYLHQAGLTVDSVSSVQEAREKLGQYQPNLIILDVIMEGKKGWEMYSQLKANPRTQSIPVIICTSKSTEVDEIWSDSYLAKPVDKEELLSQVKQLMGE